MKWREVVSSSYLKRLAANDRRPRLLQFEDQDAGSRQQTEYDPYKSAFMYGMVVKSVRYLGPCLAI